jgi:arabinose-5-phosphate isomerase
MKTPAPTQSPTCTASATPLADDVLTIGRQVLDREMEAIIKARANLGAAFVAAVRAVLSCRGRVAVTGMGKAGLVGRKIQATLASTATPAYTLHPAEAIHGDLGMIVAEDLILALTNSGETQELVKLLPAFHKLGCTIVLITGRPRSRCATLSDIVLDIGDTPEACPLGLAPSSSTTAMLALGDALALTVMTLRGVKPEQYAAFHPGGALGRSLMRVSEVMRTGADCPRVQPAATIREYYETIAAAPRRAGAAAVVDDAGKLVGFFTDGDMRRFHCANKPLDTPLGEVMTKSPKFAKADDYVAAALRLMQPHRIDELPVVDDQHRLVGLVDIQDLVACGFSAFDDQ